MCKDIEHKTYGDTICTFSYGQLCNICGQDFTTCEHHRGDTYYSIVCTPHPGMICNICNDNVQEFCDHSVGDESGCTIFAGKICNICNHNFEDPNLCEHHEGYTYDTVCASYNGKICNICNGNFEVCDHHKGQSYGGTVCEPYQASICNICHQDFSTCEHHKGEMYGEGTTVCAPYSVCNICEERFDSCPHKEGTIYDGTTCAPFTKTICNICGGNFDTCEHKRGTYYNSNIYINGFYDRIVATDYATNPNYSSPDKNDESPLDWEKHTRNYNHEYQRFDSIDYYITGHLSGSDCANFVSQAIFAGGVKQNDYFYNRKTNMQVSNQGDTEPFFEFTPSWVRPKEQLEYLMNNGYVNGEVLEVSSPEEANNYIVEYGIRIGDLIYLKSEEEGVHHAMIITKIENGKIYISAHSNDRINTEYNINFFGTNTGLIVRLK